MSVIPEPAHWDSPFKESYQSYRLKWPLEFSNVPDAVIETWIHRHWPQFRDWLTLRPERWVYETLSFTSSEMLEIGDDRDANGDRLPWGQELLDATHSGKKWLREFMINNGTTPAPILVSRTIGGPVRPGALSWANSKPFQLIEGHVRIAILSALIDRGHPNLQTKHEVIVATNPKRAAP